MRQNFEFALGHARGDYVMMIGDDDGILPGQFGAIRPLLTRHAPPVLVCRQLHYVWPSAEGDGGSGGRLKLRRRHVLGTAHMVDGAETLRKVAANRLGSTDFSPMIYYGLVRRDIIEAVRADTGQVFSCSIPDIYFSHAVLRYIDRFMAIEHPFWLQGVGSRSTGVDARAGQADRASPAELFAREAAADPIIDPLPGRLPVIEMYYLNAIEQANRVAFRNELDIDHGAYLRAVGKALAAAGPQKQRQGLAMLDAFVQSLPGPRQASGALEEARAMAPRQTDAVGGRDRWTIPSYVSGSKIVVDLRRLGSATIADAAQTTDRLLGEAHLSGDRVDGRWRDVVVRAVPLVARSLLSRRAA